ncbi:hypothetical protein SELMODRAFT_426760 [Selaginella moellendorffii]|uniref:60S ribosomal protein L7a n=1 Tax=Selaginella moellendorffii TaxID=88036 RepID=D8SXE5_SELML|nr:hypothetical protein SELMODRAFT_426760 [Selaginella moellendorffii]
MADNVQNTYNNLNRLLIHYYFKKKNSKHPNLKKPESSSSKRWSRGLSCLCRMLARKAEARPPKKDLHRFVKWPKYVRIQSFESSTAEGSSYDQPIHQLDQQHDHDFVMLKLPSPAAALFKMLLKKNERILKRAGRSHSFSKMVSGE